MSRPPPEMAIVLLRVDERLIHGQVVIGWGNQLRPDEFIVVDDALAESDWEQDLYTLALPDGISARFLTVADARNELPAIRDSERRTIVLTRDVPTMRRLTVGGLLSGESVNLGGLHYAEGRDEIRPYLYLSSDDRREIGEMVRDGVDVNGRDLPGTPGVSSASLLESP